jgi:hypothetical protein
MADIIEIEKPSIDIIIEKSAIELDIDKSSKQIQVSPVSPTIDVTKDAKNISIEEQAATIIEVIKEGPIGPQGDAGTVIEAIAGDNISALKIVRAVNATDVIESDASSTFANAKCLGITLTGASVGNLIRIQFFGAVGDASFNFPVNAPLYLTTDGNITDVAPDGVTYNFNTTIGYSLGAGAIFIDLQEPIAL